MNNRAVAIAGGLGIGAGLAYFLDPKKGRRRRDRVRDQSAQVWYTARRQVDRTSRGVADRARGLASSAASVFAKKETDDRALEERVRSRLGRAVSYPDAISVRARSGRITLSGEALAGEVDQLVRSISDLRGVEAIENRLDIYRSPEGAPLLREMAVRGPLSRLMRRNWPPALRMLVGATGGTLATYGLTHRHNVFGRTASAVGLGLLAEGVAGRRARKAIDLARRAA